MRAIYRELKSLNQRLRQKLLAVKLGQMGSDVDIDSNVRLDFPDRMSIGDRVRINHCSVLRANSIAGITLKSDVHIQDFCLLNANEGSISVGKRSWLGAGSHIYGNGHVSIGEDVLIAAQVVINSVSHNYDDIRQPINDQGINVDPVIIEDDVWIGAGTRIMQGVTIGKGAIIGANSLVNKDVPPYTIAVGSPARVMRSRLDTTVREVQA